jgi:hypothetical protein
MKNIFKLYLIIIHFNHCKKLTVPYKVSTTYTNAVNVYGKIKNFYIDFNKSDIKVTIIVPIQL